MNENPGNREMTQRRGARARPVRLALLALLFAGARGWADAAPSAAMLEPVHGLVQFMSTLPDGQHPHVFASRGLCIIEDFAPYLFCGPRAASQWEAGFRAHAHEGALSELAARFEAAYDFSQSEDRAYFSLPTTWTGRTQGRSFEEHGAWSFVLLREAGGWRIVGYGWAVTRYTEQSS